MRGWLARLSKAPRLTTQIIFAVVAVGVIIALFWPITDLIAAHDVGRVAGAVRALRLQTARDAARGRLLQLGAGLFAAAALVYTARNFTLSREGQVTDRYTKAVEQLGSRELDVRIGGIFALERVARDSPRDHPAVIEVLTALIRQHSQERWPPPDPHHDAPPRTTRPDVQAATSVIGRRNPRNDHLPIDLSGVKLARANAASANLAAARLPRADLFRTNLASADLSDANLADADLTSATLTDANLTRANLYHANLDGAELSGASLAGAILTGANLSRANLADADLRNADLEDTIFPPSEPIPAGWKRQAASGRLERAGLRGSDAGAGSPRSSEPSE